ncbi:hypothetical protein PC119_g13993 [Phytophthora cactorum]|uniref:Uncharacterized protein n=1 Tax=Phytophthora cactorum TaxID=29920 RepID=A0A8T1CZ16_9STRA|nr:hypothetical protein PC117_g14058 [Phytophthora cactorum]KAG3009153.1 hypothetical protein PC119_g13993 [Phytophthora cactorum]
MQLRIIAGSTDRTAGHCADTLRGDSTVTHALGSLLVALVTVGSLRAHSFVFTEELPHLTRPLARSTGSRAAPPLDVLAHLTHLITSGSNPSLFSRTTRCLLASLAGSQTASTVQNPHSLACP